MLTVGMNVYMDAINENRNSIFFKKKNKKHQSEHIKGEFLCQIGLFQKNGVVGFY